MYHSPLQHLEIVSPFQLYFNPTLILEQCQIWRLATTFLFFGAIGFSFFFNMIFTYRYCRMLEEGSFRGRSSDFVMMFLFGGALMIVSIMRLKFCNIFLISHLNIRESLAFVDICVVRQSTVSWPSIYNNAGVCLVATQSIYPNEFLWSSQFHGTIFTMGIVGVFRNFRQHNRCWFNGHGSWTHLLFSGRCVSIAKRWFSHIENATISVSILINVSLLL